MKSFAPFLFDVANQCLWRTNNGRNERVLLTPKAYALLAFLVEHQGRLISQDELLDAVWPNTTVEPQAVKKHIAALRSALGDDPKAPRFIETANKKGYRFIAPVTEVADVGLVPAQTRSAFVGRASALAQLHKQWELASQGRPQIVFVTGEAGIGKSALADEFRRQVARADMSAWISQGQCVEGFGSKEPYGCVLDALNRLCRGPEAKAVVKDLLTNAPTWLLQLPGALTGEQMTMLQRQSLGATRERMMRELADALSAMSEHNTILLVLEDVQWTDGSTTDLISYLARRRQPARVMLLLTCRTLDTEPTDHPLRKLIPELLVHRLASEIELPRLELDSVRAYLLSQAPAADMPPGLAETLYRQTEGNPLFVVSALDDFKKRGLLAIEGGTWRLGVPIEDFDLAVPPDLEMMINSLIDRLLPREAELLEDASVIGLKFTAADLAQVSGWDLAEVEDTCESLARRTGLVNWLGAADCHNGARSDVYGFSHGIHRQVLLDRLTRAARVRLHGRVASMLENSRAYPIDSMAQEIGFHFEQAEDWAKSVDYQKRSAEIAGRRRAHFEAVTLLQKAVSLVPRLPVVTRAQVEAELLVAVAAHRMSAFDEAAVTTYEEVASRAAELGLRDIQIQALLDLAFYLSLASGPKSLAVIDRVSALAEFQEPADRVRTEAACAFRRLTLLGWNADDAKLFDAAHGSHPGADPEGKFDARFQDLVHMSTLDWLRGDYRSSLRSSLEVRSRMFDTNVVPSLAEYEMAGALAASSWMLAGEWGNALDSLIEEKDAAERNGNPHRKMWANCTLALLRLHMQDYAGAYEACREAAPFLAEGSDVASAEKAVPALLHAACIVMGSAALELDKLDEARMLLERAQRDMEAEFVLVDWYWAMQLDRAWTRFNRKAGNLDEAKIAVRRMVARADATEERTWRGLAWNEAAELALETGDLNGAVVCLEEGLAAIENFDGPLAQWLVNTTAVAAFTRLENSERVDHHRREASAVVAKLASSLETHSLARKRFLSSPNAREVAREATH